MTILQIAREEKRLSIAQLAREAECHQSLISQVERGFRKPFPKFKKAVSKALDVGEDVLFMPSGHCRTVGLKDVVRVANANQRQQSGISQSGGTNTRHDR